MSNLTVCILNYILVGDKINENEMDGACNMRGEIRDAYTILVGKP